MKLTPADVVPPASVPLNPVGEAKNLPSPTSHQVQPGSGHPVVRIGHRVAGEAEQKASSGRFHAGNRLVEEGDRSGDVGCGTGGATELQHRAVAIGRGEDL